MTGEQIREALHAGRRIYGTCVTNPLVWSTAKYTELDFAFIDNEHAPLNLESTMAMCQVFKARAICPIVRIPAADPILACKTLDAGAEGIICPYMEDPDLLRAVVGAVKYRPLKGARLSEFLRTGSGVNKKTVEYLEERNRNNVLIINVESTPAIERLDVLLAVKGLDGVLIGPHDLSISLGIPEEYEHPDFIAASERIVIAARRAGLGAGLHYWESIEREMHYIRKGANLIIHSSDIVEASKAINGALTHLRAALGDGSAANPGDAATI